MNHELDNETARKAMKIFTYNVKGIFELPDPIQVAIVAAILAPPDKDASESIMDAINLIADTKAALIKIRSFAAGDKMKWNSMTLEDAEDQTGLKVRTIKKHAEELGYKTDNDEIDNRAVTEIKKRNQQRKLDRATAGFNASHFKQKKRRVKKSH